MGIIIRCFRVEENLWSKSGWWYTYPSEKHEFASWDYHYSQLNGKIKHVPDHQPVVLCP